MLFYSFLLYNQMANHGVKTFWISSIFFSFKWRLSFAFICDFDVPYLCIFLHTLCVWIGFKMFNIKIYLQNVLISFCWHTTAGILFFKFLVMTLNFLLLDFKVELCSWVFIDNGRDLGVSWGSQGWCCRHIIAKMHRINSNWIDKAIF